MFPEICSQPAVPALLSMIVGRTAEEFIRWSMEHRDSWEGLQKSSSGGLWSTETCGKDCRRVHQVVYGAQRLDLKTVNQLND